MQTPSKNRYRLSLLLTVLGMIGILLLAIVSQSRTTYADSIPGGNVSDPVVRAVDIAKPAVVRIFTTVNSRLTVHFAQNNDVTFPQGTSVQGTGTNYPLVLSGSGTFISANGDILTADHVVNPPQDQTLAQFLDGQAAPDIANYINQNAKSGSLPVTSSQVTQQLVTGLLQSTPIYDKVTSEVFLNTDYSGPLTAATLQDVPSQLHAVVDKIKSESAVDQKDVAIIHAPFNFDTPSVELGDSSNVQQQDNLTIIGFPGNGDVSNRPTDLLTSSVNKINVSSIKTTSNGAPVIQVGGNVEHGDSGGPALDVNGNVVGIVSFGLSSSDTPGGTSFLQASNSARDLVQSLKLDTTPGAFQKLWGQAFSDYASNAPDHWTKAQQEFGQITTQYPLFSAIKPYLDYSRTQAGLAQVTATPQVTPQPTPQLHPKTTPSPSHPTVQTIPTTVWTIGGTAAAVVVVLAVAFFAITGRRRKKKKALANNTPPPGRPQQVQQAPNRTSIPASEDDSMAAFGAPSRNTPPPLPIQSLPTTPQSTLSLRAWPCGHMNRSNARFCSICGESAPEQPTVRRVEQ